MAMNLRSGSSAQGTPSRPLSGAAAALPVGASSSGSKPDKLLDIRVSNRFRLIRKIGSGSFGEIYLGENVATHDEIAVKIEPSNTKHPQLLYEAKLYKLLGGAAGIPWVRWYGQEGDYNMMVMDLLGPSLEDLFTFCHQTFSMKTVLMLADQMLARIEYVHSKNFLHRDIKPDNFLMGLGKKSGIVHLIDFGLAKRYRDPKTQEHIPYKDNKNLTGTARYASVNTHLGIEQSRRDDLESIGYVLMYFVRGSLPWQGLKADTKKQKYERICEKKMSTHVDVLCKGFPVEFKTYMTYTRSLRFEEKPDYGFLRKLFRDLFVRLGFEYDYVFDWSSRHPDGATTAAAAAANSTPLSPSAPVVVSQTPMPAAPNQPSVGAAPNSRAVSEDVLEDHLSDNQRDRAHSGGQIAGAAAGPSSPSGQANESYVFQQQQQMYQQRQQKSQSQLEPVSPNSQQQPPSQADHANERSKRRWYQFWRKK
eukprot:TRINITY_DN1057_c0_g1_i2.p1 TRINITY_DN1057_c0_g1~~TRINITY_DN1057_c0_g1_i2.p1  ORF type:complete len:521 (-),score=90.23 TRINITY_DN1057_c0_g1_i2:1262-2692(-)